MLSGKVKTKDHEAFLDLIKKKEKKINIPYLLPLDHIAYSIILTYVQDGKTAYKVFDQLKNSVVDWNELRLARSTEIARELGDFSKAEDCALEIKKNYKLFFEEHGCLSFAYLAEFKPSEARKELQSEFSCLKKSAIAQITFLYSTGANVAISDEVLAQAKKDGVAAKNLDTSGLWKKLLENLSESDICYLLQLWEYEVSGTPYGKLIVSQKNKSNKQSSKGKSTGKMK